MKRIIEEREQELIKKEDAFQSALVHPQT